MTRFTRLLTITFMVLLVTTQASAEEPEARVVRIHDRTLFLDLGDQVAVDPGDRFSLVSYDSTLGVAQVMKGSIRFARAELVELASGVTAEAVALAARNGLVVRRMMAPIGKPNGHLGEGLLNGSDVMGAPVSSARFGPADGTIDQIGGDLVYVSGLNGSAPLWSRLAVANGSGPSRTLEVIKELDDVVVARKVAPASYSLKVSDRVTGILPGDGSDGKSRRVVYASRAEEGPRLDGRLDDPAWLTARPVEGFIQREPDYWMPSTERTEARVIYDDDALYIGFNCFISDGTQLVANNMRRDSELWGEDNVQILLDTYNDRQNGFYFFVNPLGAQQDAMISNEGRSQNRDWDCNWECRTEVLDDRWTAEIKIPFDQLRFKPSDEMVWGINLARNISSRNEETQFVVGRRSSTSRARYWTSDIGELRGLKGIGASRAIQIKPYVLPGTIKNFELANPSEDATVEWGGDIRYGITPNISFDFSYNTDFAQVEGDQEQVNLTQFRLFFPEKREFFLEGSNLFEFGEPAERTGGGSRPPTLLFYSRRIGLEEGGKIPIVFGTKVAGKEGRTSIGALNAMTDNQLVIDDADTTEVRRTNYSVLRMRRDIFKRSNIGFMFVNKQTTFPDSLGLRMDPLAEDVGELVNLGGGARYNRTAGVDLSFSPTPALNMNGFIARTWDSDLSKNAAYDRAGNAGFASFDYSGGFFSTRFRYLDVQKSFEPGVGFVNRRSDAEGFRRYDGRIRMRPRPGVMNIRYMSIGPEAQVLTDRDNNVLFYEVGLNLWTQFNTADWWRMEVNQTHDVVTEEFDLSDRRPDIVVPEGTYDFTSFTVGPSPSRSRKLRPRVFFEGGSYYTGRRYTLRVENAYRPSGRVSFETRLNSNWLRLPQGNVNILALSNRIVYSFTTNFFVKLFTQLNNDKQSVSANFLLNYRYRPGSDIFLVYDNGFDSTDGLGSIKQQNRSIILKWSYLLGL